MSARSGRHPPVAVRPDPRQAAASAANYRAQALAEMQAAARSQRTEAMSVPRQTRNDGPYQDVPTTFDRGTDIDTHQWININLRKEQGKDVSYNSSGFNANITAATVPGVGINNIEIYFDSSRKTGSDPTSGTVSFNIPAINNNISVSNCVAIRILPFYFPRLTPPLVTRPDVWFYKRLYIRMSGLPSTAVMSSGNSQHHFEMEVGNISGLNNISVDLDPVGENDEGGIFRFMTPQTSITDISFQFLKPIFTTNTQSLVPINIPPDVVTVRVVGREQGPGIPPYTNMDFEVTTPGVDLITLFSQQPAPYPIIPPAPGLAVFFTDYAGTDNAVNQQVNSDIGWMVTQLGVVNPNAPPFDQPPIYTNRFIVSGLAPLIPTGFPTGIPNDNGVVAQMLVGANRIAFRVQFVCIVDKPTNYTTLIQV